MKINKETADRIEKFGYMRKFTQEELLEKKEQLSNESIERNDLEIELKEISKTLNEKIKDKKKEIKKILHDLKYKSEYVNEECYVELDTHSGYAVFYNESGEEVGRRPLTQDERQATIFSEVRKTGTNN